jgi:hypothetical protein
MVYHDVPGNIVPGSRALWRSAKHTDAIMDACPGKPEINDSEKIIDDTIVWSDNLEKAFFRICGILSHCNENGIVLTGKVCRHLDFCSGKGGIKSSDGKKSLIEKNTKQYFYRRKETAS